MKRLPMFLMCLPVFAGVHAQVLLGVQNSRYAGIQGALLNPAFIADSKLNWDVNVLSVNEVFAGNFLYTPRQSLSFLGIGHIIRGAIDEDLFQTRFDPNQPNKEYSETLHAEVLGPSFFMTVAKKHTIGLTIAGRALADVRNITGNLGQNAFAYFEEGSLWGKPWTDNSANVKSMAWLEYGAHYATTLYKRGADHLDVGVSLNYLAGIAGAYARNTHLNYEIGDTALMTFTQSSLDYGRTDFDDFRKIDGYGGLIHGHGFGADLGLVWVHQNDRFGISLLDVGAINFTRDAATFHLTTANASFNNWHQEKFTSNLQVDRTLSAVFYGGDSTASQTGSRFRMGLPTVLSIQGDWDVYEHFYANLTLVQGFGSPFVYGITPRYETQWWEVSLPISLLYYHFWQPRVGVAFRVGYFYFGGDAPGALLKLNNLQSADVYAGVHFFIAKKQL